MLRGKQIIIFPTKHPKIYLWRCLQRVGSVCLRTLLDRSVNDLKIVVDVVIVQSDRSTARAGTSEISTRLARWRPLLLDPASEGEEVNKI